MSSSCNGGRRSIEEKDCVRSHQMINGPGLLFYAANDLTGKGFVTAEATVYAQLQDCGRIMDLQGCLLTYDNLIEMLYDLWRYRAAAGSIVNSPLDAFADAETAKALSAMILRKLEVLYGIRLPQVKGNCAFGEYGKFVLPSAPGMMLALFASKYEQPPNSIDILDLIDIDTKTLAVLTPKRHLLLRNVQFAT